jgi:hypothetical protein
MTDGGLIDPVSGIMQIYITIGPFWRIGMIVVQICTIFGVLGLHAKNIMDFCITQARGIGGDFS